MADRLFAAVIQRPGAAISSMIWPCGQPANASFWCALSTIASEY
jgi:hypothetical protein